MKTKPKHIYTFEFDINTAQFRETRSVLNMTKTNKFSFENMPTPNQGFNPTRVGGFEKHIMVDYSVVRLNNELINKPIRKPTKFVMYSNEERYSENKYTFYKNIFRYLKKHGRILDQNLIKYLT